MDSLVGEAADLVEARRNTLAAQTKVEASQQECDSMLTKLKRKHWRWIRAAEVAEVATEAAATATSKCQRLKDSLTALELEFDLVRDRHQQADDLAFYCRERERACQVALNSYMTTDSVSGDAK